MKIYLTKSIKGIGREGEVKNFPDGYAQNFIIKKGLGVVATPDVIKKASLKVEHNKEEAEKNEARIIQAFAKLHDLQITIHAQTNEYGNLFSSIHKKDILNEIHKNGGAHVTEAMLIVADEPIKKIGEYTVTLKNGIYSAKIKLTVSK
ncbi:MAG: 50S ribosomal protein L9 [Candidatus Pacebacteria bacterium]|nr:50S ribosomal protein L9 [Candidatus Paceibacterota bacterium]